MRSHWRKKLRDFQDNGAETESQRGTEEIYLRKLYKDQDCKITGVFC